MPAHVWTDDLGWYLYTSDAAGNVNVRGIIRANGALGTPRAAVAAGSALVGKDAVLRVQ